MSKKEEIKILGRAIKKKTGIKLDDAFHCSKMVIQDKWQKINKTILITRNNHHYLIGPKGEVDILDVLEIKSPDEDITFNKFD